LLLLYKIFAINAVFWLYVFKTPYKIMKKICKIRKLHKYAMQMNKYVAKLKKQEYNQFINFLVHMNDKDEYKIRKRVPFMKKYFKFLFMSVCAVALLSGCGGKGAQADKPANRLEKILAEGKLTISTSPDYAPFEFIDPSKTGQESIVGADISFAQYIADELGVELVIESMSFDSALAAVQEGKVDLCISGLAYKEDRAKAMQLTEAYNTSTGQGIMVLKEKASEYAKAEDFAGKLIGAQNGSLQYENVEKQLPDAKIETITNLTDGIMMLRTGKIDALSMSQSSGEQYAKSYEDIVMSEFKFDSSKDGTRVGVMNGEKELFDKVSEIIVKVNEGDLYAGWLEEATALSEKIAKGE